MSKFKKAIDVLRDAAVKEGAKLLSRFALRLGAENGDNESKKFLDLENFINTILVGKPETTKDQEFADFYNLIEAIKILDNLDER